MGSPFCPCSTAPSTHTHAHARTPLQLQPRPAGPAAPPGSLGPPPGDGDALGVDVLRGDGLLQFVQLPRLLELLDQTLDRLLAPLLLLPVLLALLPAQQALHDRGGEGQDGRHGWGGRAGGEGRPRRGWARRDAGGAEGSWAGAAQTSPPLSANSPVLRAGPRRCSLRGSHGAAKGGGRAGGGAGSAGPERGAEAAAASLGVAKESLGFRTGWLFGCRLQEGRSSPHTNFARLGRFDAQIPPPRQPGLPAALLLPGSLARSLGRPGPCAALPLPLPPAPSLRFMQIRVQPPFQGLSPPPCRRGSPPPPPRPAASSPGRPARPQPPGGRPITPARRGARPRGPTGSAAAPAGARRTPRGPDLSPAGAWRKSWERNGERGPRRGAHTQEARWELRAREGESRSERAPSGQRLAVHPWEDPGPREGARKAEAQEVGARSGPSHGPWPALATRGLFLFSVLKITPAERPKTVQKRELVGEVDFQKWTLGDPSDSLDNE